jgi:transcription-repair coupling factor (superfamily II helicase)
MDGDEPAILYYPSYNLSSYKQVSYHSETAAKRITALYKLLENHRPLVIVTTPAAVVRRTLPKQEMLKYAELLLEEEEIDRDGLIQKLVEGGYDNVSIVEEPGDFSVRGGILDIFPPMYFQPVRVEFFGDTVESIRFFSPQTQRSSRKIDEAIILPSRETIIDHEQMDEIIGRLRNQAAANQVPVTQVRSLVDRLRNNGTLPGMESLLPLIYPQTDTFFDYLPEEVLICLDDPIALKKGAEEAFDLASNNYLNALRQRGLCIDPQDLFLPWPVVESIFMKRRTVVFNLLGTSSPRKDACPSVDSTRFSLQDNSQIKMMIDNNPNHEEALQPVAQWINDRISHKTTAYLVCSSKSQARRVDELFKPYGISFDLKTAFSEMPSRKNGRKYLTIGRISAGFVWDQASLAVITEKEIFGGRRYRKRRYKPKVPTEILKFGDLKIGDLIVHSDQGIGRYEGLVKLTLDGVTNDFLLIQYRDDDKLYLPVDRMSKVQRYLGVDGITPSLDKMGGSAWAKLKSKVKKSVEKIAGELLKIYATRKVRKGHTFSGFEDTIHKFEADFPYDETPDQVKAIQNVLEDMQDSTPMDRLVCGDVGYGKTEVALRASYAAVYEGKQVALLVPTTVLAEQHYETFAHRFKRYPFNIACLSRFRPRKEQQEIVKGLKSGSIDIVVGTHRLIQDDIGFKDLGLLILDEEQRFGVKHKEKLKQFRKMVDVLALTATPIPRTLHMSLMGIRDISIISTPPEDRHPVITYISEYDEELIANGIRKELKRGGQIFFVHNNISNIFNIAKRLKELVPEVRLEVAHGRLQENRLEEVMMAFMNKDIDMMVTTTIIESGLDITNANTIFINKADRFGLAQIYQLRGRVGRSEQQAYAYLFIPSESTLTKDAKKRLKVLMEHSDLGSGFQIAMSDLRIRGGGTVLGASQSGHIASVGYEMYLQLMESAVAQMKGEPVVESLDPEINIRYEAFFPESYIPDIDQRLAAYRRLAKMSSLKEISEFKKETVDRFGKLPQEAKTLLLKIMLKSLCIDAGIKQLDMNNGTLMLQFSESHIKNPQGLVGMACDNTTKFRLTQDQKFYAKLTKTTENAKFLEVKNILKEIIHRVNS